MWWFRPRKPDDEPDPGSAKPASPKPAAAGLPPVPLASDLRADVVSAVRDALAGREADPDAWLVMSLLVDGVLETTSGPPVAGLSVHDAERHVAEAWSRRAGASPAEAPLRLYNRYSRNFGEGYSTREDLPEAHAAALEELRAALATAPGVLSYRPR